MLRKLVNIEIVGMGHEESGYFQADNSYVTNNRLDSSTTVFMRSFLFIFIYMSLCICHMCTGAHGQ